MLSPALSLPSCLREFTMRNSSCPFHRTWNAFVRQFLQEVDPSMNKDVFVSVTPVPKICGGENPTDVAQEVAK